MAVLLITEPSGARLPRGNVTVLVSPALCARSGLMMTSSGSTPSAARRRSRSTRRRSEPSHQSSTRPSVSPDTVSASQIEQALAAQVQHHLGHAAGQEDAHRRMIARAVGQRVDEARHAAVDLVPVLDRRAA